LTTTESSVATTGLSLGTGANFRCNVLENSGEVPEVSPQSGTELRVEHSSSPLSGSIRWVEAEGQVSFACQLIGDSFGLESMQASAKRCTHE
jgi:hypothetical protein